MPSIVIGKVKGDPGQAGEAGVSPIITLTKNENFLSISVTDAEGTKTETIDTGEAVQADWNTTDTALNSFIKNKPEIPSKVSQLANDSGYLTDYTETDPTVPAWAKNATKPKYTAVEVGALPSDTTHLSGDVPITRKVNGKTLNTDITLSATDVGALPDTTDIPSDLSDFGVTATATELNYVDGVTSNIQTQLNAKAATESPTLTGTPKAPTASADTNNSQISTTAFVKTAVTNHNDSTTAHSDIRDLITGLTTRMNALADSDDTTLDQLSEIVAYIKSNRTLIENVTTNKVNVVDIVDGLTSTATNKPLSANQGKILNDLITALTATVDNKVDGIKGNAESSYRTGNVNITPANIGLGNVGNFKAVSTVASQGLTDTEKSNARANIGAGTSSFSGSYNDLTNKPTIPTVGNGTVTIKQGGKSKGTFTMNQSGNTTIELTDNNTTYSSKTAVSGGSDVSLVTTGEKYTWNNKSDLKLGTTSTTAAAGNHTHDAISEDFIRGLFA